MGRIIVRIKNKVKKKISLCILAGAFCTFGSGQCPTNQFMWDTLLNIEVNAMPVDQKLHDLYKLKKKFEDCKLSKDSVYARLLHRIGLYEYAANKSYTKAIDFTKESISVNTSQKKDCSAWFAIKSYSNIGFYYKDAGLTDEAIAYYDSAFRLYKKFPERKDLIFDARKAKSNIFFARGDYQRCIEENLIGLNEATQVNNLYNKASFLILNAQAYAVQGSFTNAVACANSGFFIAKNLNDHFAMSQALNAKGLAYENNQRFAEALALYQAALKEILRASKPGEVAEDYLGIGNFYVNRVHDYNTALQNYLEGLKYALIANDPDIICQAYVNTGAMYYFKNDYDQSAKNYLKAFDQIKCSLNSILENPNFVQLNSINNKDLVLVLLDNKADLLLNFFKKTKEKKYLVACLQTCLLSDTMITRVRQVQAGEKSKLYWRNKTHEIFSFALEASYVSMNKELAFYFMEKSRAVLLNDKLNELGAASKLPLSEAAKEEKLQINIIEQQQKLASLSETSPEYAAQQVNFLNAKDDFEHYIKSLEQKYPIYYQYKYAEQVPSLKDLQNYLAKNNQSFVHYFIGDTVTYILAITASDTKFIRFSKNQFDNTMLTRFLEFCSDKNSLNSHYDLFAALSNTIYKTLFLPIELPKGRVIICLDNLVIPFEALCTDTRGKNFLLNDYSFSYVYAARNLTGVHDLNNNATGNFLGIAPVSFSAYLNEADLANSSGAISDCAKYYSINHILRGKDANRKNFFAQMPGYSIVNIFSHAVADSTEAEPKLFLQDSVIRLSELQLIHRPATELVVLSACQTNLGKNATGEGIYSLARGFTAAGIPSVAATLWNADEHTIYTITENFNQNLSKGMNKDEALCQAKLSYMKTNSNEKLLPYFWANIIIVGNTDPVKLVQKENWSLLILAAILLIIALVLTFKKAKEKSNIARN